MLKNITKYAVKIDNPYNCLYVIQKALYIARSGRFGPVWVEVPLDVQSFNIKNTNKLKRFKNPKLKKYKNM